jgi:transcriptional regulator with GAF, ATPase, and Fis domain
MIVRQTDSADPREGRLEFETLIADLSSRFINLPPADVDREIEDALRRVCEPLGIDLAVLWQWLTTTTETIAPTHAYCSHEEMRPSEPMRQEEYPWAVREMLAGRVIRIASLDELPAEGSVDRETCHRYGIRSSLCLPLTVGGEPPIGALGFNALREERDWPGPLVERLQLVGQVFTSALARKRAEESLLASRARLAAGSDLAGHAFYEVDFGESSMFVDERFHDLCGIPPEREQGLQALEFWMQQLHADDRERVLDARRELHEGRLERVNIEYRFLHPALGVRWLHHMACVTERDTLGRTVRSIGAIRDITERREREEALRRSHAEIEQLKDRLQAESDYLKAEIRLADTHGEITGKSAAIRRVLRLVEQVAPTDSSVLLCGETGTGKERIAQAIHRLSPRRGHVMVRVNCAALPSGLVESELFGREKGAYTGALTRQAGRFEIADGSTLFLDEIGEMSLDVQAKLLRVLEHGEFERLGSPRTLRVDVRLIAATNRDLAAEVRKGRFRQDLYYRLNVFPIRVPPLRDRPEDIRLLVWVLLEELSSRMGKKITQVSRKTMDALMGHPWPGNVRQLRNVIEHGAIITAGDTLRLPAPEEIGSTVAPAMTLAEAERTHILGALGRAGWHIKGPNGAAAALGLNPATLYSRMKKLGIRKPGQTEDGSV